MKDKILQSIITYISEHGYPPTVREIMQAVGLKSTNSAQACLKQMLAEGMIETDHEGSARAIRVPGYKYEKKHIPECSSGICADDSPSCPYPF